MNGNDCREKGTRYPGINADFILYISAINTEHCNISNTVAFASYCQLESKYNRPVAGYVNICPQSVSPKQSDIHSALATLKHEILHALVSVLFFINPQLNGQGQGFGSLSRVLSLILGSTGLYAEREDIWDGL